jgi:NAD(P) transhydrogenase
MQIMTDQHYDLIVIGSGPAGQKGAINAAKLGKRVAVVERDWMMGGVSVHTGTIPSKTLCETVLYLTGFTERAFYGRDYRSPRADLQGGDCQSSANDCKPRNPACSFAI